MTFVPPDYDRSLAATHPQLAAEWQLTRNGGWTPRDVTAGCGQLRGQAGNPWWRCPNADCARSYRARVLDRTRGRGCAACGVRRAVAKRRRPSPGQSFGELFSHLLPELDIDERSPSTDPFAIRPSCNDKVAWICGNCGDRYEASFSARAKTRIDGVHGGCPECGANARSESLRRRNAASARPKDGESFWDVEVDLREEWDLARTDLRDADNNPLNPNQVKPRARHIVWWKCRSAHRYQARISSRTGALRTGCRACSKTGLSRPEQALRDELARFFDVRAGFTIPNRISSTHPTWKVDAYLPEVDVVIEYDGAYWHGRESPSKRDMLTADREKSLDIREQGFTMIRVREQPLEVLNPHDVTFAPDADMPTIVSLVRDRINELRPRA